MRARVQPRPSVSTQTGAQVGQVDRWVGNRGVAAAVVEPSWTVGKGRWAGRAARSPCIVRRSGWRPAGAPWSTSRPSPWRWGDGGCPRPDDPPPMARRGEVRDDGRTRGRSGARKKRARDPGRPRFNQIRSLKILMGFRTLCNMPTCLTTIPTPASRFHFRLRCLCLRR